MTNRHRKKERIANFLHKHGVLGHKWGPSFCVSWMPHDKAMHKGMAQRCERCGLMDWSTFRPSGEVLR